MSTATVTANGTTITESYLYDWAGTRTAKITDGVLTYYLVDTAGVLSQVLAELDRTGALITHYTRGAELISLSRPGEKHYYLHDGHGSVRALSDTDGQVTDTYIYDAFGNLLSKTGTTANDFLYTGEQYDINTGFYYLRARYMNPSTGTFTSMDAYAGTIFDPVSLHKYLYANANPVMNRDPSGYYTLTEMETSMVISGIIAGTMNSIPSGVMRLMNGASMDGNFWCMFATEFVFGFTMGALFAGLIYLAANCMLIAHLLNAYFGIMTGVFAWKAIDAFRNGDIVGGILNGAVAILNFIGATTNFYHGPGLGGFNPSAGAGGAGDEGTGKTLKLPETQFTTKKLQHEFKHASDYGITGNWNNTNKAAFENAIKNQINSVKNPISGTYRGNLEVYHFYDAKTGLNTMIDKSGNFVGGWKLSADQIANLLRSGNIQ